MGLAYKPHNAMHAKYSVLLVLDQNAPGIFGHEIRLGSH